MLSFCLTVTQIPIKFFDVSQILSLRGVFWSFSSSQLFSRTRSMKAHKVIWLVNFWRILGRYDSQRSSKKYNFLLGGASKNPFSTESLRIVGCLDFRERNPANHLSLPVFKKQNGLRSITKCSGFAWPWLKYLWNFLTFSKFSVLRGVFWSFSSSQLFSRTRSMKAPKEIWLHIFWRILGRYDSQRGSKNYNFFLGGASKNPFSTESLRIVGCLDFREQNPRNHLSFPVF